ncbi:MAG: heme exporter protein CcmB [Archaeoglobus sp.]|nr:heme exporter protein CcmB [Archaeoglobus sp.]
MELKINLENSKETFKNSYKDTIAKKIEDGVRIATKDLKIELRSKNTLNFMLLFALLTSAIFSLSVPASLAAIISPALLWLVFLFVGINGYSRAFLREVDEKTLDGLKMAASPEAILLGKILYNLMLMFIIEAILLPIFIALFDLQIKDPSLLISAVTLGNLGFVIVASSLSILVIKSKARELLLPVILFPLLFPIITSTISAISSALGFGSAANSLLLILIYSAVMLIVAFLTIEEALTE